MRQTSRALGFDAFRPWVLPSSSQGRLLRICAASCTHFCIGASLSRAAFYTCELASWPDHCWLRPLAVLDSGNAAMFHLVQWAPSLRCRVTLLEGLGARCSQEAAVFKTSRIPDQQQLPALVESCFTEAFPFVRRCSQCSTKPFEDLCGGRDCTRGLPCFKRCRALLWNEFSNLSCRAQAPKSSFKGRPKGLCFLVHRTSVFCVTRDLLLVVFDVLCFWTVCSNSLLSCPSLLGFVAMRIGPKLGEQHPQYEMRRSSVRQACHGVHFVVLCICLTNRCADSCNPEQCKSLVTNLKDCVDTAYFGGGDNLIALCARDDGTELAVRLSVVEDIRPKSEYDSFRTMYLFGKDLARSLCGHDWIQSLIVPKLRTAMQQTSVRRILRTSEYHGEIRWRDEFLWRKMVFAPAPSLHECLACVQICSRVPVLNQNHQRVANLSRSVQIGISIMKGVDGSFKSVYEKLTVQAISTILVGYHLDLATMADSNHFHDAHEGNVLLSLSGVDFPEIRWHDFGGSYKPAGGLVTPALTADFVGKIERFSDTGINRIRMTHQDFASRLNETRKKCTLVGQEMVLVPLCLRQRAFSLVETMLNADVMDTSAQRKLLEKISLGMPELSQKELWRQFFAGRFVWRIYHAAKNATCKAVPPRNHPQQCGSVSWEALPGPYQQLCAVLPALHSCSRESC